MGQPANTLDSIMRYEINEIKNSAPRVVYYDVSAIIHTPKKDLPILFPVRYDRLKDYIDHFTDVINLTVGLSSNVLEHEIFPYQEEIEITLKLLPLQSTQTYNRDDSQPNLVKRFIARLTNHKSDLVSGNSDVVTKKQIPGYEQITPVTFQLIDKVTMALRSKTVGMIAREIEPMELIKFCLTEYSRNLGSGDTEQILGVNVAPGFTTEKREHIIIPHLSRLTALPRIVNDAVGGLYPTGFSYYLLRKWWYVFPLYDTTRFAQSDFTLTIINVPKNRLPSMEKTWRTTATQLIIVSTGEVKHQDDSISQKDSLGTATRFVDSRKVVEGFGEREDNKFITNYSGNVTEATLNTADSDPTQQAVQQQIKVTAAYNKEYTQLAERAGSKIMITWESSRDTLLYPGMPIRYMFLVDGKAHQLYGTLLASETMMVPVNRDPKKKKFAATTTLSCFMSRDITNQDVQ